MSFKKAAEELGVTPTAISHQIRFLEEGCGQLLFRRRPRPLSLTAAGQKLFPILRNGLDAFAAAIGSVSHGTDQRPLRITTHNAFAGRWLVPRLPVWRAAHPDVALDVVGTDAVLDLRAGEADVAVRYGRAMPSDLPAREIFRDIFFPVCSPEILAKDNRPIKRAADLLDYPLIHFDWAQWDIEGPTWQRWLATARSVDPDLPEVTRPWEASFREELHAIEAVVAGQGIAICSDIIVSHDLKTGSLVKAHELALPGYGYYLVHLPNHPRQHAIETFGDWIRSGA